ncbi:hypothetical protein SDC9_184768 [bioreactor metagenome]|uniref:Uncharacterized protein n=1 Tax=bioreactor metagenome TaxID=1076179 RepID=A0A645HFU5_9ZZZZ
MLLVNIRTNSCNLGTGLRVSETNKEIAVSGSQSGCQPYQEEDMEGNRREKERLFLATFRQPPFLLQFFLLLVLNESSTVFADLSGFD